MFSTLRAFVQMTFIVLVLCEIIHLYLKVPLFLEEVTCV